MQWRTLASWTLFLLILIPFLAYAVPELVGATEAYVVRSGSMAPQIPTGAILFVRPVEPAQLTVGDVITFQDADENVPGLTTHRVVGIQENGGTPRFKTKGDANENTDLGWVESSQVTGKAVFAVPYAGYILSWGSTPQGFILLVLLPAALLILLELQTVWRELKE